MSKCICLCLYLFSLFLLANGHVISLHQSDKMSQKSLWSLRVSLMVLCSLLKCLCLCQCFLVGQVIYPHQSDQSHVSRVTILSGYFSNDDFPIYSTLKVTLDPLQCTVKHKVCEIVWSEELDRVGDRSQQKVELNSIIYRHTPPQHSEKLLNRRIHTSM